MYTYFIIYVVFCPRHNVFAKTRIQNKTCSLDIITVFRYHTEAVFRKSTDNSMVKRNITNNAQLHIMLKLDHHCKHVRTRVLLKGPKAGASL